jgi:GntR family transcriptional regulator
MLETESQLKLPIYFRIEQTLLEQMQRGTLKAGDQLPSEAELARQYQVSRITAKRALDDLVRQGRAFRLQGRGSFVAQPRIREISGFRSFSQDVRARGFTPRSEVLAFEEVPAETDVCERLHLPEGAPVFLLKRLRLASDAPVAVETAYIPSHICPGLLAEDLATGSLYAVMAGKYQLVPTWADAEVEAKAATKEEARLLKLVAGKPVLAARRVTYAANYTALEAVYSVYRGDRFTFYTGRQFIG